MRDTNPNDVTLAWRHKGISLSSSSSVYSVHWLCTALNRRVTAQCPELGIWQVADTWVGKLTYWAFRAVTLVQAEYPRKGNLNLQPRASGNKQFTLESVGEGKINRMGMPICSSPSMLQAWEMLSNGLLFQRNSPIFDEQSPSCWNIGDNSVYKKKYRVQNTPQLLVSTSHIKSFIVSGHGTTAPSWQHSQIAGWILW